MMPHQKRITLAKKSLKGTSIGDAFGESFFGERSEILKHIAGAMAVAIGTYCYKNISFELPNFEHIRL